MDTQKKEKDNKKAFFEETFKEFMRSLLVGIIPVALDYIFTALIFYLFSLRAQGYDFFSTFNVDKGIVPKTIASIGTAVGYLAGFIAAYFLSTYFIFKHNKKARTLGGILRYVGVEVFAYGLNVLLGYLFNAIMSYTFAFIARIALSYIVVFTLRKLIVFMPAKEAENQEESQSPEQDSDALIVASEEAEEKQENQEH